jgi:hypothetical protein
VVTVEMIEVVVGGTIMILVLRIVVEVKVVVTLITIIIIRSNGNSKQNITVEEKQKVFACVETIIN